jgi:hypothetical protein
VTVDICGLGMGLTARDELLRQRRGGSSRMLAEALDILANEWRT